MKIIILGPVNTKTYYGGVAVFDEELALGFKQIGWKSCIVTESKNIIHNDKINIYAGMSFIEIVNFIKQQKPDYVLASLTYGKYFLFLPSKIKKIYFLHGFFTCSHYGFFKSILASTYQKIMLKYADYTLANSYFTKMINEDLFNINVNNVVHLGISNKFINSNININKKKNSILFVGRLVDVKKADKLIEAFVILKNMNIDFTANIVGDGPLYNKIYKIIQQNRLKVNLLGRLYEYEINRLYANSEVFVSLNPSEPMGIVFLEAMYNDCKIVCPHTGGQVELLEGINNVVSFVNEDNPEEIALAIKKVISTNSIGYGNISKEIFLYKNVAINVVRSVEEHN